MADGIGMWFPHGSLEKERKNGSLEVLTCSFNLPVQAWYFDDNSCSWYVRTSKRHHKRGLHLMESWRK